MSDENYCKLFVDINKPREFVVDIIQKSTNGNKIAHFIDCDWASFDVRDNDESSRWKAANSGEDGFLYFKYIIDSEKNEHTNIDSYIKHIHDLIQTLKNLGAKVVAACDFEDQL
jgi:adenylate cyclase class IV